MRRQPTRRFGEQQNQQCENAGGYKLDSERDAPLRVVESGQLVEGCSENPGGDEGADAEHKLLEGGDAVADGGVRNFGLVYGDDYHEEADAWGWLVWW